MPKSIHFRVDGRPQQRGSKQAFANKGGGRPLMVDANKKSGPWMTSVAFFAAQEMLAMPLIAGPINLTACFEFKRPKAHYRTGKNADQLKPDAPYRHTTTPDCDKLVRAIGDAMTGVIYRDDAQISQLQIDKIYTEGSEGVTITVTEITPTT